MKVLWIKADFLHPTTKGGHIRTLEMLRRLHRRHEIHYLGLVGTDQAEGPRRSREYSTRAYPIPHRLPRKDSGAFVGQALAGLFSSVPVAVSRYRSEPMATQIEELRAAERFDRVVCDFLTPAVNLSDLSGCVLFQHNVETVIWRRRSEHAADPIRRWCFRIQADRMFEYEREACRSARHVVAVSETDAALMRTLFGASRVSVIPTGVDLDYFRPPGSSAAMADLVFVGSMDWLPNVDGVLHFRAGDTAVDPAEAAAVFAGRRGPDTLEGNRRPAWQRSPDFGDRHRARHSTVPMGLVGGHRATAHRWWNAAEDL